MTGPSLKFAHRYPNHQATWPAAAPRFAAAGTLLAAARHCRNPQADQVWSSPHVEPHLSWRIHPLSSMFSYQIWITPSLPVLAGHWFHLYDILMCENIHTTKSVNFSSKLHHQRLPLLQWWECLPWVGSDLGCRAVGAPSHSAPLANPWLSARRPEG